MPVNFYKLLRSRLKPGVRSVHSRGRVDGGVAGGTLRDAGAVVEDVGVAVGALAALLLPHTPGVQLLAKCKGDAAPALVGVVVVGATLHTGALVLEAATGHAVGGRVGLQAAAQALVVAALVVSGAGAVFALNGTH